MVAGNSAAQRLRLRGWGKRRADWRLSWPGQIVCRHQATSFLDACWPVEMAPVSAKIVGDQSLNVRRIWAVFAVYATSDNASFSVSNGRVNCNDCAGSPHCKVGVVNLSLKGPYAPCPLLDYLESPTFTLASRDSSKADV